MAKKQKKRLNGLQNNEQRELSTEKEDNKKRKNKKSVDKPVELQSSIGRYMNKE